VPAALDVFNSAVEKAVNIELAPVRNPKRIHGFVTNCTFVQHGPDPIQ
jgi:hypothetical protein